MNAATFSIWLSMTPYALSYRICIPNTHFQLNGRICFCDYMGRWSDANCNKALSSENCLPGEIIWKDCNQCICQENRQFLCTNSTCTDKLSPIAFKTSQVDTGSHECTPFRSYYVDCYLCTCPASGLTKEARCVPDKSCMALGPKSLDLKVLLSVCIPNVMYVFNCINCMCSENGYFILSKCINTCIKTRPNNNTCVPGTLYKSECNVCKCYNNSVPNNKLCTNVDCNFVKKRSLPVLQNETGLCVPNRFTRPKCFYCECGDKGAINKNACYELNCLNDPEIRYDLEHRTCSPGEIVPFCMVCFCLYNGIIDKRLCSKSCSFKNKVYVLEKMLKESFKYPGAFNRKRNDDSTCEPHTVFIDHGKYCICPDDGNINSKYCILSKYNKFLDFQAEMKIGSNISCTPNTFVDFDCNTCYCNKSGKIDVSWCTYDDCESKRQVQQKNRANEIAFDTNKCTPGSISKKDCNFCICPESLLLRERACTNNTCHTDKSNNNKELDDKLYCDPLEYYTVDCNLCYCPHDGLKNIDKCTKKVCEKNFLRSNLCEPGDLFANDCKICVCPPNGDKKDSVCTNHTCSNADIPWNKVFKLTQDLLGLNNLEVTTRSIDPCFPGEEFTVGCKICVCPEMGLRKFATCTPFSCDINNGEPTSSFELDEFNRDNNRRQWKEGKTCITANLTNSTNKECPPGLIFITRCRECICPCLGDSFLFCRPLPKGVYCEQPLSYLNSFPTDKSTAEDNLRTTNGDGVHTQISHNCNKSGYFMDKCFICDCQNNTIVEENCFKSEDAKCNSAKPTFMDNYFTDDW